MPINIVSGTHQIFIYESMDFKNYSCIYIFTLNYLKSMTHKTNDLVVI